MILQERENLKLTCAASGDPKPVENQFSLFFKIGFPLFWNRLTLGGCLEQEGWTDNH